MIKEEIMSDRRPKQLLKVNESYIFRTTKGIPIGNQWRKYDEVLSITDSPLFSTSTFSLPLPTFLWAQSVVDCVCMKGNCFPAFLYITANEERKASVDISSLTGIEGSVAPIFLSNIASCHFEKLLGTHYFCPIVKDGKLTLRITQ